VKNTLAAGINATREFVVDRERTIDFMGDEARVYATPMLVRDIEVACRELLLSHLDPGDEIKGRAITFQVSATDGGEPICRGRHTRFVVDVAQTRERLRRKQTKAA
jgi:predicted thioesterase